MTKLRILAAVAAIIVSVASVMAQSNISLAFTGFGFDFGKGESTEQFLATVRSKEIWERNIQKSFVDLTSMF